jgi:hypothetical protein
MDTFNKNSPHRLLRILFFFFEAMLIASFAANEFMWQAYGHAARDAGVIFGFAFLISLVGLLVVCYYLRHTARLLAWIGIITAFVLFTITVQPAL